MLSALNATSTGLSAAMTAMNVAATNIANAPVEGYRRLRAADRSRADGGVDAQVSATDARGPDLESDLVGLLQAKSAFLANLAVFRRADEAFGKLIDEIR